MAGRDDTARLPDTLDPKAGNEAGARPDSGPDWLTEATKDELGSLIRTIPEGWSRAEIDGHTWAVTRTTRAGGKVISVDAEQLGTAEQFGTNVWITSNGTVLRPCEVPAERVMRFLRAASTAFSA